MKHFYALLFVFISFSAFSQTGPGGVGNTDGSNGQPENILWLDAGTIGLADGAPVTNWSDIYNGLVFDNSTSNPPEFVASTVNGLPAVLFDDGNQERFVLNPFNNMADDEISTIIVFATANGSEGVLSYAVPSQSNEYLVFDANNIRTYIDNSINQGGDLSDGANTFNIFASTWRSADGQIKHFKNSLNVNTSTIEIGSLIENNGSFVIGGEQDAVDGGYDTNQDFGGQIAEVIVYKNSLTAAELQIVENYLSQKYNITISNDLFGYDADFDISYAQDIRGIGVGADLIKKSSSGFSDALQVDEKQGTLDAAHDFALLAHDGTTHAQGITTDITVDPGVLDSRWARSWFVEVTGSVATQFTFDFGTAGFGNPSSASDYVLLYRASTADEFTRIPASSYTIVNTDQLVVDASNSNLTTGYYTIAEGEPITSQEWFSYQSGDWNDPLTWTTDPSSALRVPVAGGIPLPDDNVTVRHVVTMDSDDNDAINLAVENRLVIGNTSGHNFFNISGDGTISISGDVSGDDNFPSGSTTLFADSIVGGTVEILGAGLDLNQNRQFNNIVFAVNNGSVATLTSNYIINGDLSINNGTLTINNGTDAISRSITTYGDVAVNAGAEINVGNANARHEFNFYGNFTNNGNVEFTNRNSAVYNSEATDGIVDANFLNNNASQVIDCNGATNFYRIEIDKGNPVYELEINALNAANFNLFGYANQGHGSIAQLTNNSNALGLLSGTVKLNENVDVPVLNNTGNYNVSESARLWINGGSAEKPAGTAIVAYGTVQLGTSLVDGGGGATSVLTADINSGITMRDNGSIIVHDGTMNLRQIRTSINGPLNIGGYIQTGGAVNVTGGSISNNYYAFSLTYSGNTFNMSGGTLHVAGAPNGGTTGGIFIASLPSNVNITGGTVIMDISRNDNFKLTSRASFWNVIMRKSDGSGSNQVDMIGGTSGNGGGATTINNLDLKVLNDLIIEDGVTFDHNGFDVEIGSDFIIQTDGEYIFDAVGRKNTTTINGFDDAVLNFQNINQNLANDEQQFWNLIINKPTDKVVTLESGNTDNTADGANANNALRIDGDFFKVLSGTLDQGFQSIRLYADTLVNYDVLTVYDPVGATNDAEANGDNDILKLRDDGGSATVFITADSSRFGAIKLNSGSEIINLVSDVKIDYLEYRHGRINLDVHNLTIDRLNVRLTNEANGDGNGSFSVEDMLVTSGNASDGGLSLRVNADGTNPSYINISGEANTESNPTVFYFPIGTGTSGVTASSEYTPANIRLLSATDDGYITVIPVTKKLATAGPYPLGNDVTDRYWIVDYSDFTTVPKVERMWFQSVEKDDPNGGPDGFQANYVPGFVLDDAPYTRTAEVNSGNNSSSNIDNQSAEKIRVFFWGNTGGGNPAGGFDLVNAAYTAGDPSKFVGAPDIFYTRLSNGSSWYNRNWQDNNNWSTVAHDGATNNSLRPSAGDYPREGDIAVIGYGGYDGSGTKQHAIKVRNGRTVDVAKIIYENPFNNANRLVLERNANINFDIIEGTGGTFMQRYRVGEVQLISGDFGSFYGNENFTYSYYLDNNGTFNIVPPTNTFPNLRIEGGNSNRIAVFQEDIVVNNDLRIDGNTTLRTNNGLEGDIIVKEDLLIGGYLGGNFIFNDAQERIVEVGRLRFIGSGNSNITVDNSTTNGLRHRLIINDDIIQDRPGNFDLSSGIGVDNNNVILEFAGEGNHSYTKTNGNVAEFFKIEMNKDGGLLSSFTINEEFILTSATTTFLPLEINSGVLILNNNNIDITVLAGTMNLSIPSNSGLNIEQGIVHIDGDDSGIILDGSLIIDGGILDMDDAAGNGNNFIEYSASGNAIIEISAGELIVGSQIRPLTSAETGILKYRQTGGDVTIGTQSAPQNDRGMLQVYNSESEFIYTGGTLTIERHQNSPTVAALYLDPEVSNVTETITIFNGNTPGGQNNFGINSTIALENLVINGTNSPTAILDVNPLVIKNELTIASNATLEGDIRTLTVGGDMINDGVYDGSANETIFNSTTNQIISGVGVNNFNRFTKAAIGNLSLSNAIDVNGLFTIAAGSLNDNGFDVNLFADAVIDGIHISSGGNGVVFTGSTNQELRRSNQGTGTIGVLTIDNSNNVTIPDGSGYDFNINGGLNLNTGVFDIGSSNILLGINAEITAISAFSVTNMIKMNTSFTDGGVAKQFTANYNQDFTFPVGRTYYTPVAFNFGGANTFGTSSGSITVKPANEYHPVINDGNDFFGTGDVNNVLQYYWTILANNITGLNADMAMLYDDALVLTNELGFDETDYIAARILRLNNPNDDINKFDETSVNESSNIITFSFSGSGTEGISGDYFTGIDEAIPDNVTTYIVANQGGSQDVDNTMTYDATTPLPTDGVPPSGSVIQIPNGTILRLNEDNIRLYRVELEEGGILEVDNTTNHRLGILTGTGTMRIVSDGINANIPAYEGNFFSCSGGALEYAGTGSYGVLGGINTIRALTLSGSGDRDFPNSDVEICEDLIVDGPIVNTRLNRRLTVDEDTYLMSGEVNAPGGGSGRFVTLGEFRLSGGVFNGSSSGRALHAGKVTIEGGVFNAGNSGYDVYFYNDFELASGNFNAGSGNSEVIFFANNTYNNTIDISGDFVGSNSFRNITIDKNNLGEDVRVNNHINITGRLKLEDGKMIATNNAVVNLASSASIDPVIGRINSYITGKVVKTLLGAGQNFSFPTGSIDLWRPSSITNVSTGGLTWEAEYFQQSPTAHPLVDNLTPTDAGIETISNYEYWVISDNSTGNSARVGLSWGIESDVSSQSNEREELEVMVWNDGISSWDNLGGTAFSGSHTQSRGRFIAVDAHTFSEHVFTLGSSNAANPLPVELISFTGKLIERDVLLEWGTASELNNDYFELQRSVNGIDYERIATIKGNGTTQETVSYSYTDRSAKAGYNYYRLLQVDYDGTQAIPADPVLVVVPDFTKEVSMIPFPNPTSQDDINLRVVVNKGEFKISIIDMYGRKYYTTEMNSENVDNTFLKINPNGNLPSGMYIISLEQGNIKVHKRVMIK